MPAPVRRESGDGAIAHTYAIVGHFDDHAAAFKAAAQGDGAAVNARFEAVLDAVLNQRLEGEWLAPSHRGCGSISRSMRSLSAPKRTTSMSK